MLRSVKELEGYTLRATDGDIGTVRDFYFDDRDWTVRYLAAEYSVVDPSLRPMPDLLKHLLNPSAIVSPPTQER